MDAVTSKLALLLFSRAPTMKEIWETRILITGILLGFIVMFAVRYIKSPWRRLPPGPRGFPVIGNALQLMDKSWLISRNCKERFGESPTHRLPKVVLKWDNGITGEIIYLDAAGQPTVILNGLKTAFDLLDHRASIYSDRPRLVMAHEILSNGLMVSLMNYGERYVLSMKLGHPKSPRFI
jgi:hypothetical protein